MKAKIYGFEVEGTPTEIAEFKDKIDKQYKQPNQYTYTYGPVFIGDPPPLNPMEWNKITCVSIV
ncbi:hypothetical protein [Paenibacillus sp. XY044]|uniref:hypothetical protein n=1 Tax=Paenibacillus sp. XY044 TaxID=2026089 RepID=UPI000B998130|nr:hypothetical protein [Paenibacillus sp. XY044]OZB98016.1 hypothetical protein CJP46_02295 [Paenibacillus sp. XY044]